MQKTLAIIESCPDDEEEMNFNGMISFVSVEIFNKYLDSRLISDEDESVVRPVYIL